MRLAAVLFAATLLASEDAVLSTGARIRAVRHEVDGDKVRLFTSDGLIEIPASLVTEYEPVPDPPKVTAPEGRTNPTPPPTAKSAGPADVRKLVDSAAEKYGLPREFLHSVARTESAYQPAAVSHKGAIGVMQLMPATAAALRADPYDPAQNVDAGAKHLSDLLVQYGGSSAKALAAYNAGSGAVAKYGGIPPYAETQSYVRKVIATYQKMSEGMVRK